MSCIASGMEMMSDIVACIALGCVGIVLITGTIALVRFFYKGMK